jgi:hypothetical protein
LYPFYAVLGAPARVAIMAPGATYFEADGSHGSRFDRSELPAGAKEFSIARRGVTFTTAAVLWIVWQLLAVV